MSVWRPIGLLIAIVAGILLASRWAPCQRVLRWFPIPLWCYALPLAAVTFGWLPRGDPSYRALNNLLLPFALGVLLLGVNLPSVMRSGARALTAAIVGALGIIVAAAFGIWLLRAQLPAEAWKGAGCLAGTWTGGTMNLLALRSMLDTPEEIFAPLILVDAMIAYGWMALLIAASGFQEPINRWLRAPPPTVWFGPAEEHVVGGRAPTCEGERLGRRSRVICALLAVGLALSARWIAPRLPTSPLVSSSMGWTVMLVTTSALALSLIPRIRRTGAAGSTLGYSALYLVLAATGAQASVEALWSSPLWLILGLGIVLAHGAMLLVAGRLWRIPLGVLATASQANIGGVVSAPLVGAVYERALAPVGLLLAMAGNALGTYLGWSAAVLSRWLTQQ